MSRLTARDAAALVALIAFAVLLALVRAGWGPLHRLDVSIDGGLNDWSARHRTVVDLLEGVTNVGQPFTFQVLAVAAGIALWRTGRARTALFVVVTVLGAGLLGTAVKYLVARSRPTVEVVLVHPAGSSFPSGHSLTSFVALGVLVLLVRGHRALTACAAAFVALAIGFSRLALGAHYLSDVVGAWLLGTVWVLVTTRVLGFGAPEARVTPPTRR